MSATALWALIRNDLRLYLTDRRALIVGILVPILMAGFFGYIFGGAGSSEDRGTIPIGIVDEDQSSLSRAITADLGADPLVSVTTLDREAARDRVKAGRQSAAAVFPKGFGEQSLRSLFTAANRPRVEVLIDPSQRSGARVIEGLLAQYAMKEIATEAFRRSGVLAGGAAGAGGGASGRAPGDFELNIPYTVVPSEVTVHETVRYNGYAHSVAGMSVQFILFAGIDAGIALLLLRERGLWQRMRSAPLSRGGFILARALATTLIGLFQITVVYAVAMLLFEVRVEGSWPGLVAVVIAFCLLNAGFGLMLATLGRSASTTRGLAIMATLLMVMVGGAWVPAFIFPRWLQDASRFVPTRWAIDGLDGATWRGLSFEAAVLPTAVLIGSAAACVAVAMWRFRWEE